MENTNNATEVAQKQKFTRFQLTALAIAGILVGFALFVWIVGPLVPTAKGSVSREELYIQYGEARTNRDAKHDEAKQLRVSCDQQEQVLKNSWEQFNDEMKSIETQLFQ